MPRLTGVDMNSKVQTGGTFDAPPRKAILGASEIGAILGYDPWTTRWAVWAEKRGLLPENWSGDNELTEVAKMMEDLVADVWARRHPEYTGYWRCREYYWHPDRDLRIGASIDYLAREPGRRPNRRVHRLAHRVGAALIIECKTTSPRARDAWEDGRPPMRNRLQVQQQLMCSPYEAADLPYLIDRHFEDFPQEPRAKTQERIRDEAARFWKEVDQNIEPPFDGLKDADALRMARLFGEVPKGDLEGDEKWAARIREYVEIGTKAKKYGDDRKRLGNEIVKAAAGYKRVICPTGEKFSIVRRAPKDPQFVIAEFVGQKIQVKAGSIGSEYAGHFKGPKEETA